MTRFFSTLAPAALTAGLAMAPLSATASSIVDLIVEGGGTQQVFALDNGNFLGLWGFDNRAAGATDVTISDAADITGGFTSGASSIVAYYNGTNPVNAGAAEFDPLVFSFTVDAGARLFDSLWIEWTGGPLAYAFDGKTRTMNSTNITRDGDPFAGAAPIPLPAAGWLLLAGLGALGAVARRRAAA